MKPRNRLFLFMLPLLAALVLSAAAARPAYADDSPPPADSPSNTATPSSTTTADAPRHGSGERGGSHRPDSLAGQAAADNGSSGDPIWCPAGVAPKKFKNGCSDNFTSGGLLALVTGFHPTMAVNGVIWLQNGSDGSAGDITISSASWTMAAIHSLTLKGGWNGVNGSTGIIGTTTFTHSLSIIGWLSGVNLSNITISGATTNPNFVAAQLFIEAGNNISLNRVQANGSATLGGANLNTDTNVSITNSSFASNHLANLFATAGGAITLKSVEADASATAGGIFLSNLASPPSKSVVLSDVTVLNNAGTGLLVQADGAVTISDLTASGNTNMGASIANTFGPGKPVVMKGTNIFSGNHSDGLDVLSEGAISLHNVIAVSNGLGGAHGVFLQNDFTGANLPVKLTGTNLVEHTLGSGLTILSAGAVSIKNLTASDNTNGDGASIDNRAGVHAPVTLTGFNAFNINNGNGLHVQSSGAISLSNVTAEINVIHGVYADNCAFDFGLSACSIHVREPVKLLGVNSLNKNSGDGLFVTTVGAVTISKLTASGNDGSGADIEGAYPWNPSSTPSGNVVYVNSLAMSGYANVGWNSQAGLLASMHGPIKATNITALHDGPSGYSAVILTSTGFFGAGGTTAPGKVTLTGFNNMSLSGNTFAHSGHGLDVHTDGKITISNLTADGNAENGAILDNYSYSHLSPFPKPGLTLLGTNSFSNNHFDGLGFLSPGAVSLSHVTANFNGLNGITSTIQMPISIKLTCGATLGNVLGSGLSLHTAGTLSLLGTVSAGNGVNDDLTYLHLIQKTGCP